jgi:surface antigen
MRNGGSRLLVSGRALLAGVLVAATVALGPALAQEPPGVAAATASPQGQAGDKPVREYNDEAGRLCRVYARAVVIGGERQPALAVVCRETNGRWVLSR